MDVTHIQHFLNLIGCRRVSPASRVVRATCPFEYLHSKGEDKHPSFAVKIADGDESGWKCFGCKRSGALEKLVQYLELERRFHKEKIEELYKYVWKNDRVSLSRLMSRADNANWKNQPPIEGVYAPVSDFVQNPPKIELPTLPDSFLDDYFVDPDPSALKYLVNKRGFTEEALRAWEIKWHPTQKRIAIPVRRMGDHKLVGISGRAIDEKINPKYLHSKGFKGEHYLFGEHRVVPGGTGIFVEGQFDVIALWQYGYKNAVGIFGSFLNKPQLEKAVLLFSDAIVLTDGDKAGKEAADQIISTLGGRIPTRAVELPKGKDPGNFVEDRASLDHVVSILGFAPAG